MLIVGGYGLHTHGFATGTTSQDSGVVGPCAEVAVDNGDETEALRIREAYVVAASKLSLVDADA